MTRTQVREHLFKLLFRVEFAADEEISEQERLYFEDSPADQEEDYDSAGADIPQDDAEYIRAKFAAIMDKKSEIDDAINKAAKGWTVERIGKIELAVLRLSAYEMIYDDDIPVGVAIDEAVELAKKFGQDGSPSFINGILAGILKQNETNDK